jgi:3-dehydrosphinganine reductase
VLNFEGKTVWIIGGSSGIGLELAKRLAGLGSNICIFARDETRLKNASTEISQKASDKTVNISWQIMDVSDEINVKKAVSKAVNETGIPDILINSAGIAGAGRFEDMPSAEFDHVMKTNVSGTRYVIAAAIPLMKGKGGHIVILSSLAGLVTMYGYSAYGASKYALVGMAEALRQELKKYKIRVTVVCPPEVETPFIDAEIGKLPAEGKAVKMMAGRLNVEESATAIIRGIRKNSFFIVPGKMAKFSWFSKRFMPSFIMHFVTDFVVWIASRKK